MLSNRLLNEIKKKSELLDSLKPLSEENQSKLDKKFRLEFNFNSNHLEGNTLTYGETELLLIFDQTEGTHDFREYQEMQAHDVALKMIQEEARDDERPLTEQFIRSLNAKLLVKPFWKDAITADGQPTRKQIIPGDYKKTPNSVRLSNGEIFAYSAPEDVHNEIAELVAWFNDKSETENPILLAAILHYRFVRIHPFDDGNGRTARLLMNYVFAKNNLPLVIIKSADKKDYLAALNRADTGDLNSFSEYIGNQLLWSLNLCIKAAKGENIDEDDDLDKELELLKQELKGLPNEFGKTKTFEEVALILLKSIVPLHRELQNKLEGIGELFVEFYNEIIVLHHENDSLKETRLNIGDVNLLFIHNEHLNNVFDDYKISSIRIDIRLLGFKKSKLNNLIYHINFKLEEYQYIVYDGLRLTSINMNYGEFYDKSQINSIVKNIMKNIIEEIKSATNLKN